MWNDPESILIVSDSQTDMTCHKTTYEGQEIELIFAVKGPQNRLDHLARSLVRNAIQSRALLLLIVTLTLC